MELTTVWLIAIAFFWVGYFVLEGFDFGVGILMHVLGRNDRERRVLLNTIGPVWDANEVWLIVAIGATFAAFPHWYATMLSGLYIPVLVIVLAMIVRVIGIDFRGKSSDAKWRRWCDLGILAGSVVPAFCWGLILANLAHGLPIDADGEFAGTLIDVLNPYAILGGLTTLALSVVHGSFFVALKTAGELSERAQTLAGRTALLAGLLLVLLVGSTVGDAGSTAVNVIAAMLAVAACVVGYGALAGREGWAFIGTAASMGLLVVLWFVSMFPAVMVSSLNPSWSLTTNNAAASTYTLTIMSWVAIAFVPLVVVYQGWSYWVFRRRISTAHIPDDPEQVSGQ